MLVHNIDPLNTHLHWCNLSSFMSPKESLWVKHVGPLFSTLHHGRGAVTQCVKQDTNMIRPQAFFWSDTATELYVTFF